MQNAASIILYVAIRYMYKYVSASTTAVEGSDLDQVLSRLRENSS